MMQPSNKTPKRFLRIAAILAGLYLIGHVAGLRELTSVLSGTFPASQLEAFLGVAYAITWFGLVLVAPILTIAAALRYAVVGAVVLARRRRGAMSKTASDAGRCLEPSIDAAQAPAVNRQPLAEGPGAHAA